MSSWAIGPERGTAHPQHYRSPAFLEKNTGDISQRRWVRTTGQRVRLLVFNRHISVSSQQLEGDAYAWRMPRLKQNHASAFSLSFSFLSLMRWNTSELTGLLAGLDPEPGLKLMVQPGNAVTSIRLPFGKWQHLLTSISPLNFDV